MVERKLRSGEYIIMRGTDNDAERADCKRVLRNNGCKSVRFEPLTDGRLQVHGYLAVMSGVQDVEPV
jgi:hypothetical protein